MYSCALSTVGGNQSGRPRTGAATGRILLLASAWHETSNPGSVLHFQKARAHAHICLRVGVLCEAGTMKFRLEAPLARN